MGGHYLFGETGPPLSKQVLVNIRILIEWKQGCWVMMYVVMRNAAAEGDKKAAARLERTSSYCHPHFIA